MNGLQPAWFAALLTAAGAPIASAIIWAAIDFLKSIPGVGPLLSGRERVAAFIGAILVVVLAITVGFSEVPPRYAATNLLEWLGLILTALLAVYNVGRLAMAVHDDVNQKANSLTGPAA